MFLLPNKEDYKIFYKILTKFMILHEKFYFFEVEEYFAHCGYSLDSSDLFDILMTECDIASTGWSA